MYTYTHFFFFIYKIYDSPDLGIVAGFSAI